MRARISYQSEKQSWLFQQCHISVGPSLHALNCPRLSKATLALSPSDTAWLLILASGLGLGQINPRSEPLSEVTHNKPHGGAPLLHIVRAV